MRASTRFVVAGIYTVLVGACLDVPSGPEYGRLVIEVTTTGKDLDVDGYTLWLNGIDQPISATGQLVFPALAAGRHVLDLGGLAPNCVRLVSAAVHIELRRGATETVRFTVTCAAYLGSLRVLVTTSGRDVDSEYQAMLDGQASPLVPVGSNASSVFERVAAGAHLVLLGGIAPNCAVNGPNPLRVDTQAEVTTDATFSITCAAFARLRVVGSSTGVDLDPNGYRVQATGTFGGIVPANGELVLGPVPPGEVVITVDDIALNCEVSGGDSQTITAVSDETTEVRFDFACAPATPLAFVINEGGKGQLYTANSNGTGIARLAINTASDVEPSWSPDGSQIAFRSDRHGNLEIYVMGASGNGLATRLTNDAAADYDPAWSPDGGRIAFVSHRDDASGEIYLMNADGSNILRLTNSSGADVEPAWSPDGTRIVFRSDRTGDPEIHVMNADGSNVTRLTNHSGFDGQPAWSPDGSRIAFARIVSSCFDSYYYYSCNNIFVMNADGIGVTQLESSADDSQPAWSPDGQWIAFAAAYCDYYGGCWSTLEAVKRTGDRRTEIAGGYIGGPAWRP